MNLDSVADKRPIKVLNDVQLDRLTGDLEGLVDSLAYGPNNQIYMNNMDVSKVPGPLLNSFFKTFRTRINLFKITGISFQLMSGINCKRLVFRDIEFQEDPEGIGQNINLDIENLYFDKVRGNLFSVFENIKHCRKLEAILPSILTDVNMTEVLKDKLESLYLKIFGPIPIPDWLQQYDGDGMCVRVEIFANLNLGFNVESYVTWARERGWKVEKDCWNCILSRPE